MGSIYPETVDKATNRRTRLKLTLNHKLPSSSLISLDSVQCACPDPLHAKVRIVEVLVRKIAQCLLNEGNINQLRRFEDNLTKRYVKCNPRFQFEIANGKVGPVSLSGSDATAILANPSELEGSRAFEKPASIFAGVYHPDDERINLQGIAAESVFAELHPKMKHGPDEQSPLGYFKLKQLAEANFQSLNLCFLLLRSKSAWDDEKLDKYKDALDSFYTSTNLLFSGEAKLDFTPYMLKLDLVWRVQQAGFIAHPYNHLGEGGEKGHHTASNYYYNKTMRDGGRTDRHCDSQFTDLHYGFIGIARLALEEGKVKAYADIVEMCRTHVVPKRHTCSCYSHLSGYL